MNKQASEWTSGGKWALFLDWNPLLRVWIYVRLNEINKTVCSNTTSIEVPLKLIWLWVTEWFFLRKEFDIPERSQLQSLRYKLDSQNKKSRLCFPSPCSIIAFPCWGYIQMSSCPPPHRPCPQCNKSWSENAWWIFICIGFDALNVLRWPGDTYSSLWSLTVVYGFHPVLNIHPFRPINMTLHSLHAVTGAKPHRVIHKSRALCLISCEGAIWTD